MVTFEHYSKLFSHILVILLSFALLPFHKKEKLLIAKIVLIIQIFQATAMRKAFTSNKNIRLKIIWEILCYNEYKWF